MSHCELEVTKVNREEISGGEFGMGEQGSRYC